MTLFIVVCRLDSEPVNWSDPQGPTTPGEYALTSSRVFITREDADEYVATVAASREPAVVETHTAQLRRLSANIPAD